MNLKRYMFIVLILLVCMVSISAVSAAEDATDDIISADNEELILDEAIDEDVSSANDNYDDELILDKNVDDKPLLGEGTSTGSFTDLDYLINQQYASNDTITLSSNYAFNGTDADDSDFIEGIIISNREVTIDGNGFTIDGSHKARIFNIGLVGTIKFININFINGNATGSGGAIYTQFHNCNVENCNFTNNTAEIQGGAVFGANASNCNFIQNQAESGGAVVNSVLYDCTLTENQAEGWGGAMLIGIAYGCNFTGNYAGDYGGAMYSSDAYDCNFIENHAGGEGGAIMGMLACNCNFTGNYAVNDGGAIYDVDAYNCTFTGNHAGRDGGAVYVDVGILDEDESEVYNCNFTGNYAGRYGGAIFGADAYNSTFTENQAEYSGGAITNANAYNCTFTGNYAEHVGRVMHGNGLEQPRYYATLCIFGLLDPRDLNRVIIVDVDLNADDLATTYHSNDKLFFNLTSEDQIFDGFNTTIKIYNQTDDLVGTYYALSGEGWVVDLVPGTYRAVLSLEKYEGVSDATATITVDKASAAITPAIDTINLFVGDDSIVEYSLNPDDASGVIGFNSSNTSVVTVDSSGAIKAIGEGTATITISLTSDTYVAPNATVNVKIDKKATNLKAEDMTINYGDEGYLVITLTDSQNNPINNTPISVEINGESNTKNTSENGQISVLIKDLNPNTYTANIRFEGNGFYNESSATATITVIDEKSFWYLNQTINNNSAAEITLDKDYKFNPTIDSAFAEGILINRTLTIDGNGSTIDGNHLARIFKIESGDVVFKNINFINGLAGDGGATYGECTAISCNFTDNQAYNLDMQLSSAGYGGAMYHGTAINCNFTNNQGLQSDSGFMGDGKGGAIYEGSAINCTFIGNRASFLGGALFSSNATNCTFVNNTAGEYGGGIYRGTAMNCNFTNNTAYEEGGGMSDAIAVNCTFTNNKYYASSSGVVILCINESNKYGVRTKVIVPNITASDLTTQFNSSEKLLFNLTASFEYKNEPYFFKLDGFNTTIKVFEEDDLIATCYGLSGDGWVVDLSPGTYKAELSLDKYPEVEPVAVTITIPKIPAEITPVEDTINMFVEDESKVEYTLNPADAVGNITFTSSNPNVVTVDSTGRVKATGEGTATITISLTSDDYEASNATVNIIVSRKTTKLSASAVTATYNVAKNLVITLKDADGNPIRGATVTVDLNGAKKYTTDKKGQVKVAVGKLVPKTYTAKISFAGNNLYKASSATAKVTVKKATPKMTAKAKTFKFEDKTKKYTVTLKNNKGAAMKNTKVTLKVGGKTYTAKTNSKGVATFKLTKLTKKGKFNAVITYAGNKYYKKLTKKAKITVKAPAWKTVAKGSKDKATVKKIQQALKDNGYYLTYKGHYLKVDGKYSSCTERSVKQFQKAKGLSVTGKVDYATAKKLKLVS